MKRPSYLIRIAVFLLVVFTLCRFAFVWYNHELTAHVWTDMMQAWLMGLPMDVATVAYALTLPAVVTLVACRWQNLHLRWTLAPYWAFLGLSVGVIIVFDTVMYEHWGFKLGADAVEYAKSPEGATNSASPWYIGSCVASALLLTVATAVYCIRQTKRHLHHRKRQLRSSIAVLIMSLICAVGYRSQMSFAEGRPIFLNHAAVNAVYNFYATVHLSPSYSGRFQYMSKKESEAVVAELYKKKTDEQLLDTLLRTKRPDILMVMVESFGGMFVEELGGISGVAPNLSRHIPEGIFWDNHYSNSFRTDRGTVALYSGMLTHPDVCLIKEQKFHPALPSLPRDLSKHGYHTVSLMGQPMTNMGKRQYFENMGFQEIYDYTAFSEDERKASWGAHDDVSSQRAVRMIAEKKDKKPMFLAYQTISSHDPWVVPYDRLSEKRLNAFAFVDQCLGNMVDSLRTLPQWDNLLVIILPDHGYLYNVNFGSPQFFHSPMLWTGGAIREPRRMAQYINQSDIAATLLAQLGIPYDHYRWSRNVLGSGYTHPFVYCNFPAGMMLLDPSGANIYDLQADRNHYNKGTGSTQRLHRMKAIMQASYKELDDMLKK